MVASLTEGLPMRPVIEDYIRIVKDKSLLRRLMAICSSAIARAADQSETALEVLDMAESQLLEVSGLAVPIGTQCLVDHRPDHPVTAEAIGFRNGATGEYHVVHVAGDLPWIFRLENP